MRAEATSSPALPGLETDQAHDYFRDVYDHLIRISEQIDSYRDLLTGALDVYLSTVSNRMNGVMKQLAVVSTIFLPLTFVTGFFGQNFGWLVDHVDTFGDFMVLGFGFLVIPIGLMVWWFRRSGFFEYTRALARGEAHLHAGEVELATAGEFPLLRNPGLRAHQRGSARRRPRTG